MTTALYVAHVVACQISVLSTQIPERAADSLTFEMYTLTGRTAGCLQSEQCECVYWCALVYLKSQASATKDRWVSAHRKLAQTVVRPSQHTLAYTWPVLL
jgi:hypothetical protein